MTIYIECDLPTAIFLFPVEFWDSVSIFERSVKFSKNRRESFDNYETIV